MSYEECREIAKTLREYDSMEKGSISRKEFAYKVANLLINDYMNDEVSYRRLADLIEPEVRTCFNAAPKRNREAFVCSECLFIDTEKKSYMNYCPVCGAVVVE